MRKRSGFRVCVWLAAALLLAATTSVQAQRVNVGEMVKQVKQVIPKVGQQLSRITGSRAFKVSAVCAAAACFINFAAPTDAVAADFLSSDAQLVKSRGINGIFTSSAKKTKSLASGGVNFSHWAAIGNYHESGDNIGTLRFGTSAEIGNFSGYWTAAFRTESDIVDGVDNIGIKTRSFVGGNILLFNYGEDKMSYGALNTDIFVGGTKMHFRNARAYLLRWDNGTVQIAGIGYEFVDNDLNALSTTGNSGDPVRSHGVALYRAGVKHDITDLITTSDALTITVKLNSAIHLGDIGPVKLGETWQDELNDWAGEEANLDHLAYHTVGGGLNFELADGRVKLYTGGTLQHTIDGDIKRSGQADGDFEIINTILAVGGSIDLLPEHGISIEGHFERYDQSNEGNLDGKNYDDNTSGTWARIAAIKKF